MKNRMMKTVLTALVSVILLQGCGGPSSSPYSGNPWERSDTAQPARTAPGNLDPNDQWLTGQRVPADSPQPPTGSQSVERTPLPFPGGVTAPSQPPSNDFNAVFGAAGVAQPKLPPVKVAILVPMSGSSADVGEAIVNAAQLALFDVGADTFELLPRDTKGTAAGARAAAESVIHEGAQMILGPLFAEEVRAAAPVAASSGINMVAFTTDWKQAGANTFVLGFMPFGQVQRVIGFAAARGARNIGVVVPQNDYGSAVMSAYSAAAQRAGITTVDVLRFRPGDTNLSAPVQKLARYDARKLANGSYAPPPFDAVFLPVGGNDARAIANLLSYYELDPAQVRRLGTGLWDDGTLGREANLNGGWFAAPDPKARRIFENKYKDAYGAAPPRLASLGYDATALAAVLAKTGLKNGNAPAFDRAALTNPNGFAGIDGIFRFRPDGLAERGLAILEFRNGEAVVIDPAPKTFQSATQ